MYTDGIITGFVNVLLFILVYFIRKYFLKENLKSFLIHYDIRGLKLFFEGIVTGFIIILLYPVVACLAGLGEVYFSLEKFYNTLMLLISFGFGYFGVALFEEGLFRGFIVVKLNRKYGETLAIVISSVIFGLYHIVVYISLSGILLLGLLGAGIIGAILSLITIRTNSLMYSLGFHMIWNLIQTIYFAKQNRGYETIFNVQVKEGILTGSSQLPESGLIVYGLAVFFFIYCLIRFGKYQIKNKDAVI